MYRVVLVDDEQRIVEGLRKVVHWADYRCEVVGTAGDAVSGAEVIRREKADILFTDIRMTGEDGLTMLAGLRSEFEEMEVTVLTGYRDFAYAQEAIRLGVTRFLLKPSRMDEINEALAAMVAHLDKRRGEAAPAAVPDEAGQGAGNFIVRQAVEHMKQHYAEKLTLQGVADSCYVSQWHLSKLLNKYLRQSFYDILNEIRIQAAMELLKDSSLKIGDIGLMVGYTDNAHFARVFKKIAGVSAAEYRNNLT